VAAPAVTNNLLNEDTLSACDMDCPPVVVRPIVERLPRSGGPVVNAGEILQRLAGVKVQHGRKQEGPRSGAFLLVASHS
jgi:hypothetical protein